MALRPVLFALAGLVILAGLALGGFYFAVVKEKDQPKPVIAATAPAVAIAPPPRVVIAHDEPKDITPISNPLPPTDDTYKAKVLPFLQKYCVDCHKGDKPKGGLALDGYVSEAHARKDRKNWGAMQHVIASGEMPPAEAKKAPKPTKEEKEFIINWIENSLTKVDCSPDKPKDPGRVTIRRLNRVFTNAVT